MISVRPEFFFPVIFRSIINSVMVHLEGFVRSGFQKLFTCAILQLMSGVQ